MIVLGINCYHPDASACILKNGKIIVAVEEERLNRIKHYDGFPEMAIDFCMEQAKISPEQIDYVAVNKNFYSNFKQKLIYNLKFFNFSFVNNAFKRKKKFQSLRKTLLKKKIKAKIFSSEHHLSHIYNAVLSSKIKSANIFSVDGFGDFVSTIAATLKNNKIFINKKIYYPNSLGIFYQGMTQLVGFKNFGDEYKLMGMSAFGKYNKKIETKLKKLVAIDKFGNFKLNLKYYNFTKFSSAIKSNKNSEIFNNYAYSLFKQNKSNKNFDSKYVKDIAYNTQLYFEKILFEFILKNSNAKNKNIILTGGCAQNSKFNGLLTSRGYNVFIPPAPHDAGGSIGAAMHCYSSISKKFVRNYRNNFYSNKKYNDNEIIDTCKKIKKIKYKKIKYETLINLVVNALIKKKIIGWFQDGSEFGPRALGNRSIIADPRGKDAKRIINKKIKMREKFRPFAPSILSEKVVEWFEQNSSSEYMNKVINFKKKRGYEVPAVKNIDNTGRLHTVTKKFNPKFYNLIKLFYKKTNVPILLNTSFNNQEPIVETPKDAINCFLSCDMDLLIINDFLIEKLKK